VHRAIVSNLSLRKAVHLAWIEYSPKNELIFAKY